MCIAEIALPCNPDKTADMVRLSEVSRATSLVGAEAWCDSLEGLGVVVEDGPYLASLQNLFYVVRPRSSADDCVASCSCGYASSCQLRAHPPRAPLAAACFRVDLQTEGSVWV